MNTIKFYKIPDHVKELTFDGQESDLRLHCDYNYRWGAKNKRNYDAIEKKINKMEWVGKGWTVYFGCDGSGFQYWMKNMREPNYIMISVMFDAEDVDCDEVHKISEAIESAKLNAKAISDECEYFVATLY